MLRRAAPKEAELRLALGMRGGVSLAVWIGGACAEIDELRRAADEKQGFWWEVLQASPYGRVTVDVMAGASAGGLNGVLFAAAIRHGFRMDQLLRIWKEVADVNKLRRETEPWSSLFDGDTQFLDVVHDELTALIEGRELSEVDRQHQASEAEQQDTTGYVDLQLSATLVEPIDTAAISPGDEQLRRSRSTARFHFRHDPSSVPRCGDLEADDVARLAVAARATASFPVAFEGAVVRASRPAVFEPPHALSPRVDGIAGDDDERTLARRLVDCRGVFSESRGAAKEGVMPFGDDDFVVADGGAVDNIPLGKALDAARDAPAKGPTRRVLVYLHPTGPAGVAGQPREKREESSRERAVRRRNPVSVLSGLVASQIQSESIDGDLERLEAHNRTVRLGQLLRQTLLAELAENAAEPAAPPPPSDVEEPGRPFEHAREVGPHSAPADLTGRQATAAPTRPTPSELAGLRMNGYRTQRAGADAEAIQLLLADPLEVLGGDPFPVPPESPPSGAAGGHAHPDDRWRSPIACWTVDQRLKLGPALHQQFAQGLGDRELGMDLLVRGPGPVARSVGLLLELAREGEKQDAERADDIGAMKPALYRLGSFVRELVRVRQLAWVCRADALQADDDVGDWVDATLEQLRRLTRCDQHETAALTDPNGPDFDTATQEFLARCAEDLQTLAGGEELPVDGTQGTDLRAALVIQLEAMAKPILDQLPPLPTAPVDPREGQRRSGAEVIQRVLTDASATDWAVRLASLEVLLVDEHLLGAPGLSEIGFTRMSAAAPIIGADRFRNLHKYSLALDEPFTRDGHHLAPDVKLAGNELASFSAFLDERWRVNDWTWGRLDATATLVDLLIAEDRADRQELDLDHERLIEIAGPEAVALAGTCAEGEGRNHLRRALTARRQTELLKLSVDEGLPEDLAEWRAGLETLVNPGSPALSGAVEELGNVAAQVLGSTLPSRVPRVIGPLQGVIRKLTRQFARPAGVLPDAVWAALEDTTDIQADERNAKRALPWLILIGVLVGGGLAALTYAVADNAVGLAVGLLVGLVVGLVPGAILLWLAVQPVRPLAGAPSYTTGIAKGLLLGLCVAALVAASMVAFL